MQEKGLYHIVLFIVLLFCSSPTIFAQSVDKEPEIGLFLSETEEELIERLIKEGNTDGVNFSKIPLLKELFKTVGQTKWEEEVLNASYQKGTQLRANNYYLVGDSTYTPNAKGTNYSSIGFLSNLSLLNIPIGIQGDAVFSGKEFDSKLSTLSVSFDAVAHLNQLKQRYYPSDYIQEVFKEGSDLLQFTKEEADVFKSDIRYNIYQQVISNPKYRAYATQKLMSFDSLQKNVIESTGLTDTILNQQQNIELTDEKKILAQKIEKYLALEEKEKNMLAHSLAVKNDSTIASIKLDIERIESISEDIERIRTIRSKYDEAWENKKVEDFNTTNAIRGKVETYRFDLMEKSKPEVVKQQLSKDERLKGIERLLLYTKKLDIGLFSIDKRDNIASHLSLNGVRYAYEGKRFSGEVAYGNQSLSTQFLPSIKSLILNRYYGRKVFYTSACMQAVGGGMETEISLLRVTETNNPDDTLFVFPKRNMVLGWSGKTNLMNNIGVKGNIALASHSFGGTPVNPYEIENTISPSSLSWGIKTVYEPQNKNSLVEFGYFYNGANYISLGNPYLLTNRQGISLNTRIHLLNRRLMLNGELKYSKSLDNIISSPFNDFQYLGEVSYRLGKSNMISARFIPNIFSQGENNDLVSNNTIYSMQGSFFSKIKEKQLVTIFNLTNLRTDLAFADTISLDNRMYLYLQESLFFGQNNTALNMTLMGSIDQSNLEELKDLLFQLDGTIPLGKWSFTIGGQLIKQQYINAWQAGVVGRISCQLSASSNLNFYSNYRRAIDGTDSFSFQSNLSVVYSLWNSKNANIN